MRSEKRHPSVIKPLVFLGLQIILGLLIIYYFSFFLGSSILIIGFLLYVYKILKDYFKVLARQEHMKKLQEYEKHLNEEHHHINPL